MPKKKSGKQNPSVTKLVNDKVRHAHTTHVIVSVFSLIELAIKWGSIVWIVYICGTAFGGKETDVKINALLNLAASKWLTILVLVLLGGGCWVRGKVLRKRVTTLTEQKRSLEKLFDSKRSSSGMNEDGSSPYDPGR